MHVQRILSKWMAAIREMINRLLQPPHTQDDLHSEKGEDESPNENSITRKKEVIPCETDEETDVEEPFDRTRQIDQFCEDLRRQGRFLPAWEEIGIRQFLAHLCASEQIIDLSGTEQPVSSLEWFRWFVESLPPFVQFGELASDAFPPEQLPTTLMPSHSARIDNRSITLHRRVLQIMSAEPSLSYAQALRRAAE